MATRDKSIWILLIFICSGQLASQVEWLNWLSYGQEFGLKEPFILELNVIKITFGLMLNINIASIIGMAIALFLYRKI